MCPLLRHRCGLDDETFCVLLPTVTSCFPAIFLFFFLAAVVTSSYWSTNMVLFDLCFCTGCFGDGVLAVYFVTQLSVILYIVLSSFDNLLTCTP